MKDKWKNKLTPEQYGVMRRQATEPPFTGKWLYHEAKGTYVCAACQSELFSSATKFDSGTGWPSFWDAENTASLEFKTDSSHGRPRIEVKCRECGSHLGHIFDDGPEPTGKRYCINSLALEFNPEKEHES